MQCAHFEHRNRAQFSPCMNTRKRRRILQRLCASEISFYIHYSKFKAGVL